MESFKRTKAKSWKNREIGRNLTIKHEIGSESMAKARYRWLNSPTDAYQLNFERELKGKELSGYLHNRFADKKINALDLGGVGEMMFLDLQESGVKLGKTLGVTLHQKSHRDFRGEWEHEGLIGDIFSPGTFQKIKKHFGKEKIDFIISRMAAGLELVPENPFLLYKALNNYYSLLGDDGSMLLQVPVRQYKMLNSWKNFIMRNDENFGKGLNIEINLPSSGLHSDGSLWPSDIATILIEKENDAPKDLPKLSAKEVFKL